MKMIYMKKIFLALKHKLNVSLTHDECVDKKAKGMQKYVLNR